MSVVVTIRRTGPHPLTRSEIEQALEASPDFEGEKGASWRLVGTEGGAGLHLNVENDEAWTDGSGEWLADAALAKLRSLAIVLEARLLGEEGEDITSASPEVSTERVGKLSATLGAVLAVVLLPLLALFALIRLPWVLWRVTRHK
jgi:hypothetical protein